MSQESAEQRTRRWLQESPTTRAVSEQQLFADVDQVSVSSVSSFWSLQLLKRRFEVRLKRLEERAAAERRQRRLEAELRDLQMEEQRSILHAELEEAQLEEEELQLLEEPEVGAYRIRREDFHLNASIAPLDGPVVIPKEPSLEQLYPVDLRPAVRPKEPSKYRLSPPRNVIVAPHFSSTPAHDKEAANHASIARGTKAEKKVAPHDSSVQSIEGAMSVLAQQFAAAVKDGKQRDDCPKVQLQPFSGKPADFPRFMRNFEATVEPARKDHRTRLNLLIQYCEKDAACHIEDCVNLDPEAGHLKAKQILQEKFGTHG
jgi:hypothetical protein